MTFTPNPPFGTGAAVNATVSTINANFGAQNFPNSPNTNGETSTEEFLATLNTLNIGTLPPSNASTT